MRPRFALSLLALALPVPVMLSGITHAPARGVRALPAPTRAPESLSPPSPTASPVPRQPSPRPVARRTASRTRPAPAAQRHHRTTAPPTTRARATTQTSVGYPWASDTTGGNDAWGFTKRQCVSYVAWRLDRAGRTISTRQGWGSASGWDDVARRRGVTVSSRPSVGSVAQWNAGERSRLSGSGSFFAGSYGHVGWVTEVYADGSVRVAQYNGDGSRSYSTMRVHAPRFLRL